MKHKRPQTNPIPRSLSELNKNLLQDYSLNENQRNFLLNCMDQNLEHARHIEIERLTINSIYTALVSGCLAFTHGAESASDEAVTIIYVLLLVLGVIVLILTVKWNRVFGENERHAVMAYTVLHLAFFPGDKCIPAAERSGIEGIKGEPLYRFSDSALNKSNSFLRCLFKTGTLFCLLDLGILAMVAWLIGRPLLA